MSTLSKTTLRNLKLKFEETWKKIEPYKKRRKIKETTPVEECRTEIVETYNKVLEYITDIYSNQSERSQVLLKQAVENNFKKIKLAVEILKINYVFNEDHFAQIDKNNVVC